MVALLDVSASMGFGSHEVTKLDYARYLTACLLHFSRGQRDRVGLVSFDADVVDYIPASAKNLELSLHTLARAEARGRGELRTAMLQAAERLVRRGIVILVSDFYQPAAEVLDAVRLVRGRGHDVVAFHLLDPAERELPGDESTTFRDMESGEEAPILPARQREAYRKRVEAHVEALRDGLTGDGVDYVALDTSRALDHALFQYLTIRERKARRR